MQSHCKLGHLYYGKHTMMATWQDSDFETNFYHYQLWKGIADNVLLGFHQKGRGEGREEDCFSKVVSFHNSCTHKKSDRAGAEVAQRRLSFTLGTAPTQANRMAAPSISSCCRLAALSPVPIPFLILPTLSSAGPLGHLSSTRAPPVIYNISLTTRGTSAPCSGLDCQCTGWELTEKVDTSFEDTFSISTDSLKWRPRKIKYLDGFSTKIVVLKIRIPFLGALRVSHTDSASLDYEEEIKVVWCAVITRSSSSRRRTSPRVPARSSTFMASLCDCLIQSVSQFPGASLCRILVVSICNKSPLTHSEGCELPQAAFVQGSATNGCTSALANESCLAHSRQPGCCWLWAWSCHSETSLDPHKQLFGTWAVQLHMYSHQNTSNFREWKVIFLEIPKISVKREKLNLYTESKQFYIPNPCMKAAFSKQALNDLLLGNQGSSLWPLVSPYNLFRPKVC